MKKILCLILIVLLLLCTALIAKRAMQNGDICVFQSADPASESTGSKSEQDIIKQMLYTYCWDQERSREQVNKLLEELEERDADAAKQWRRVIDAWDYVNNEMELNKEVLPPELEDSQKLCIVVLGFALNPDGSMKEELIGRLETALASAKRYPDAYLLCTGGGTASSRETTEADAMAQWLEDHGIAPERIIVENKSLTTTQNAINACQILSEEYPEVTSVAVITSDYHARWGIMLFETAFILGGKPISVVSNAVFETDRWGNELRIRELQLSGILEIAHLTAGSYPS